MDNEFVLVTQTYARPVSEIKGIILGSESNGPYGKINCVCIKFNDVVVEYKFDDVTKATCVFNKILQQDTTSEHPFRVFNHYISENNIRIRHIDV